MNTKRPKRSLRWLLPLCLAIAAGGGALLYPAYQRAADNRLLAELQQAEARGEYELALRMATKLLKRDPDSVKALRAAASSAHILGRDDEAIALFGRLARAARLSAAEHTALGEVLLRQDQPQAGEQHLRKSLELDAGHDQARASLVYLLSIECRTREAAVLRRELLRQGVYSTEDLLFLGKSEDLLASADLDAFFKQHPDDAHLLLAKARHARVASRFEEAEQWLRRALDADPDLVEAHADLGLLLLEREATEQDFAGWQAALPDDADEHPDVWHVRGFWAKSRDDLPDAARCFAESLRRDANHRPAAHQLSLVLASLGAEKPAEELSERVTRLDRLNRAVDQIYLDPDNGQTWLTAAGLLESLGRIREAAAWYRTIGEKHRSESAVAKANELYALVEADTPFVAPDAHPLRNFELSRYPLPAFEERETTAAGRSADEPRAARFVDVAPEWGLRFAFIGADEPVMRPRRIFELFGGGLAALDFDNDGWPDFYCAQGAPRDKSAASSAERDQLFRGLGGAGAKRFVDVTGAAHLGDERFSQGVAAGDFDNDGFTDLLVGNVGQNRLYRNNGDGTFSEVSFEADAETARWTTSVALADLNGDALPDIYEVNYLGGPRVLQTICDGQRAACSPTDFPAKADRFFLNLGDGTFAEQTSQAGFTANDGKGLGIVAADFGDGRISVFVANDTTANHFYVNQAPRGARPEFQDRAIFSGLAYDRNGLSQACMGVAVDDIDGDGQLDLLVTNFSKEANTLYRGGPELLFEDASREVGLLGPSLPMLGFGTEWLDADLDGDCDLVVVNGHIESRHQGGAGFQMRPQYFENRGGRFVEHGAKQVGDYFDRRLLGRSLARVDFDRDGRPDFAVSHLDAPVSLLHNATPLVGGFLAVNLRGVSCDRDAIGTKVTIVAPGGTQQTRQITAGDGYLCSNQRQLLFGLGETAIAAKLIVRWPGGGVQEFENVSVNREITIIESREQFHEISGRVE